MVLEIFHGIRPRGVVEKSEWAKLKRKSLEENRCDGNIPIDEYLF